MKSDLVERMKSSYRAGLALGSKEKGQLLKLLRERAIKRGTFSLSSGASADCYFDCRCVTLLDEGVHLAAMALLQAMSVDDVSPKAVAGPVASGLPLITAISLVRRSLRLTALAKAQALDLHDFNATELVERLFPPLPALAVRPQAQRAHGTQQDVEGLTNVSPGSSVALVDDVAISGNSLVKAIHALSEKQLQVVWVGCLVDRQEGARERLVEAGYELHALFTAQEVLGGQEG